MLAGSLFGADDAAELGGVYYQSGLSLVKQNKYDQAITKLTKALSYQPNSPPILFSLAECCEKTGDTAGAIRCYRLCVKYLPVTGRTKDEEQLYAQSTRTLDKIDTNGKQLGAIKLSYTAALLGLANDCVLKKYIFFATRFIGIIRQIDPAHKGAQELSAKLGGAKPRPGRTKTTLAYLNNGNEFYRNGDYDSAIAQYSEAIKLNPKYFEAYVRRADALWMKDEYDQCISDCNQAIKINPDYGPAYSQRADGYARKGDFDRAIAGYDKAIKLSPRYVEAYVNRGNIYGEKGDFDRAIESYDKAIKINPKEPNAYASRSMTYANMGNFKAAIADGETFLELAPKTHPQCPRMKQLLREWRARLK